MNGIVHAAGVRKSRHHAHEVGRRLTRSLVKRKLADPAIIVMSTGGATIGWEIARRLHAPMDVMAAQEVVVPGWRQVEIGAVAGGHFFPDQAVISAEFLPADYVERLAGHELHRLAANETAMRGVTSVLDLTGRAVILVDDGWAAPRAVESAIEALKKRGAVEVVFATPLCSPHVHRRIQNQACVESLYPSDVNRWVLLDHDCLPPISRDEIATLVGKSRHVAVLEPESIDAKVQPGRDVNRPSRNFPVCRGRTSSLAPL